jgi:mycothiol synthase
MRAMQNTEETMQIEPRLYRDQADLDKMRSLLQAGRRANNGTYYIHTGDLNWWLFYPGWESDTWQNIFLWDDPADPQRLLGWALFSLRWGTYDVYIQPDLRGTPQAEGMYTWAEGKLTAMRRASGKENLYVMWVSQEDKVLNAYYQQQGYQHTADDMVYMTCTLDGTSPAGAAPAGYIVRSSPVETDVQARASAQYNAFGSSLPMDIYIERIRKFMQSPVYDPDLNVVAVDTAGQVGSFCTVWLDPLNKTGLFEPVGTHPDFQRRGLGKAVMVEALRRLHARGMTDAMVCTSSDNAPAIKLYESVGFHITDVFWTYKKDF